MLEEGGPDGGGDGGQSGGGGSELTRDDPQSSRTETLFERGTLGGLWTNAELFPDGSWHLTQVLGPTADQLMWSHNQTASDGLFWLPDNIQASIASHLTDWGIDVSRDGVNLVQS